MDPWLRRESKCIAWIGASLWRTCLDMAKQIYRQRRVCSFLINCDGTGHGCASWLPCAGSFSQPQDAVAVHQKWNGQWKHVIQDWWEIPRRVRWLFWTWGHRILPYEFIVWYTSCQQAMASKMTFCVCGDTFTVMSPLSGMRLVWTWLCTGLQSQQTACNTKQLEPSKTTFSYASFRGASRTTSTPPTGWELQFTCTRSPKT